MILENFERFNESKKKDITDVVKGDKVILTNGKKATVQYLINKNKLAVKDEDGNEKPITYMHIDKLDEKFINEYWDYAKESKKSIISAKVTNSIGHLKNIEVEIKVNFTGNTNELLKDIVNSIEKELN
jgi:preprotein translocase subunit YajC